MSVYLYRTPDKVCNFISIMPISSSNLMFDHLLSNKWSNIGFDEEIMQVESIEVNFTHLIWSSE